MRRIKVMISGLILILPAASWADADSVSFSWLLLEPGSRPGGTGNAFTGLAEDANAVYYNAGGIALQEKNNVLVMHEPRGTAELKDMFYDYVAGVFHFGRYGSLGAAVTYHDHGKSEIRDEQNRLLGYMHSYGIAPNVTWSYRVFPFLGVGAGFTYAYEHLTDQEGGVQQQPLFNAGVLYQPPLRGLRGGLAFTNLGVDRSNDGETSYPPPRAIRLGVSYKIISNDLNDLLVIADGAKLLVNFNDSLADELGQGVYSGGVEYVYAKMVAVRAGYYSEKVADKKGLSLGFGFAYRGVSFDYAMVPEGEVFKNRHRFGVGYAF